MPLPTDQYVNEVVAKDQIFVHHTAGSPNPYAGCIDWWKTNKEAVSTAFVIAGPTKGTKWKDGEILQCFSSKKWGWHLGLKAKHLVKGGRSSKDLNAKSIGIEICNWGYLTEKNGKFYNYNGGVISDEFVVELDKPYKGHKFWNRYTDAQLENTRRLLVYLCDTYSIDRKFKGMEIFDIDPRCLKGENGIWTHTSCRPDKFDCFPQVELIQMLESL